MKPARASSASLIGQMGEFGSQISHAQRFILMTVIVLVVAAGIGIAVIQIPWQESRRKITGLYQENTERAELLTSLQVQITQLNRKEKDFLLSGGTPVLTGEVTRLAAESKLEIESVSPRDETTLAPYTKFQIEVFGSAIPENLLRFLQKLERYRPLLTLDELAVGNLQTSSSSQPVSGLRFMPGKQTKTPVEFNPDEPQKIRLVISAYSRTKSVR